MKVIYIDEYDEELMNSNAVFIPRVGDTVLIDNEDEYFVKQVIWNPISEIALVVVSDYIRKSGKEEQDLSGRLNEMNRAILDLSKQQENQAKKGRALNEQLVTVRTAIRSLQKPKKQE